MAVTMLPGTLKVTELKLFVGMAGDNPRRQLNKTRNPLAPFAEMWQGQIAFAAVDFNTAMAQAARIELFNGRVTAFGITLKQGFATHSNTFNGTLATAAVAGSDTINLLHPTLVDLRAGTLLGIGEPGDANYQMVEVLETVSFRQNTPVHIAPRIRNAITASTAVVGGDVTGVFKMARDSVSQTFSIDNGAITIDVIEAV